MKNEKPILPEGGINNQNASEIKGLQRGKDGWALYWSDGQRLITQQTHIKDRIKADYVLNDALVQYWLDKKNGAKMQTVANILRQSSPMELEAIASLLGDEMKSRCMDAEWVGWKMRRKGIWRVKDSISRHYDRIDIDE
jgi:hypothetical protein